MEMGTNGVHVANDILIIFVITGNKQSMQAFAMVVGMG